VRVQVEAQRLEDVTLDRDQLGPLALLGLGVALADAGAAVEQVGDGPGGDLDVAQLFEGVLELGSREEGRDGDVDVAVVGEGVVQVKPVVDSLCGGDRTARARKINS